MREIALDTETTGLEPGEGHRITEIGCVELINFLPTGRTYHTFINPERDVPPEVASKTGIQTDFLKPFPVFAHIAKDFLEFLGDDKLVIHNATFDLKFLNAELDRLGHPPLPLHRATDTLKIARKKFPGSPASLDALCRRFQIDLSDRKKHGALLDAKLLAKVYLELAGGRQTTFAFEASPVSEKTSASLENLTAGKRPFQTPRFYEVSEEEISAHQKLINALKDSV